MSFCITTYVREGIIMSADSRITYSQEFQDNGMRVIHYGINYSETTNKLFLTDNNIGISTCGDASISGVPISGFVESFLSEKTEIVDTPYTIAEKILNYFKQINPSMDTVFHIAGYLKEDGILVQKIYNVNICQDQIVQMNPPNKHGATWNGEIDILMRLIQPVSLIDSTGNNIPIKTYNIDFGTFTLQDAIDFNMFTVRSTIDCIRFQMRNKTVGGPIDTLVIKPTEAFWLKKKSLEVKQE